MSSHIQVCCRIRPLGTGESPSVKLVSQNVVQAQALSFKLDHAFDSDCSQKDVFCAVVRPMIVDSFKGFNCSLFSYGQTGSGKTHTLFGSPGEENRGIVPRSVLQIFETAEECLGSISVLVRMSVLEIYQEKLRDLLCVSNVNKRDARNPMRIREHADGSVWVEGLEEKIVSSPHEFERFMETATKKRIVGSHSMNNVSSRSHLCCILTLNQTIQASGEKMISKVHLIDLAGSEMVRFVVVLLLPFQISDYNCLGEED